MDRPLKVEVTNKKNTLFEYTDTYYARKTAKNTAASVEALHEISGGIERTNANLHSVSESMKAVLDSNLKTAQSAEITALLAQKADGEKREQKAIKNTVFAFKQDMEFVNSTNKGLARFLSLKALTDICDRMLVPAINRLEEISDKEFANNLIKTVYSGIEESFANLTDPEKDDLNRIERHLSEIGEKKLAIDELSDDFDDREALIDSEISRLAENNNAFEKLKALLLAANDKKISTGAMTYRLLLLICLIPLTFIGLIILFSKWQYFKEAFLALFNKDARKKSAESIHLELDNKFAPNKIQSDIEGKRKEMLLLESSFDTNEQKLKQEMATIEQALNQLMVKYNLNV